MKRILPISFILFLAFFLLCTQIYRLKPKTNAPDFVIIALKDLGSKALKMKEVPVGAVLVYGDSIIGKGFNTVVRDTLISGHAELNALNDAHKSLRAIWKSLDRSKMTLYSTYEPCEMCKGAMIQLNIGYCVFEGPKPVANSLKNTLKTAFYELKKARLNAPGLQENLFRQHPDYHQSQ